MAWYGFNTAWMFWKVAQLVFFSVAPSSLFNFTVFKVVVFNVFIFWAGFLLLIGCPGCPGLKRLVNGAV